MHCGHNCISYPQLIRIGARNAQAIEIVLGEGNKIRISHSKLGKILTRLGYKKIKSGGYYAYCIKQKGGRVVQSGYKQNNLYY